MQSHKYCLPDQVQALLKGQLVVAAAEADGTPIDATGAIDCSHSVQACFANVPDFLALCYLCKSFQLCMKHDMHKK